VSLTSVFATKNEQWKTFAETRRSLPLFTALLMWLVVNTSFWRDFHAIVTSRGQVT